jgi:hypothetical protein
VTGSNSAQPFTINGNNFVSGANVTLRDLSAGQTFPNRVASSFNSMQIVLNPIFTTAAHQWSVEVINPDGQSSGQFQFAVVVPTGIAPVITTVSPILPQQTQTIMISGSGFGTQPSYTGNSHYIRITDVTRGWNAGSSDDPGGDAVTLAVASWTDSQIVISGFTGAYGQGTWSLNAGDTVQVQVWNAQTHAGPATYTLSVGSNGNPNPTLHVTSPNGGEVWTVGSTHLITWTSSNLNPNGTIFIFYYDNIGSHQIAGPLSPTATSFSWTVPNTRTTSSKVFLGNWFNNQWEVADDSDQPFTIQ